VSGDDPGRSWSVGLAAALRRAGVEVGTGQVIACRRALAVLDDGDRTDRYLAGRTCLVSDPQDLEVYDRVFAWHETAHNRADDEAVTEPPGDAAGLDASSDRGGPDGAPAERSLQAGAIASERERLRARRFGAMTEDERARVGRMLEQLHVALPRRASRRSRPGKGRELDLGRTLERAIETDGEPIDRVFRVRRRRPRRLVVLLDVSGSMASHARVLLRFAVAARRAADRDPASHVEVFAFGTRLTRLSDALAARDPDRAIALAADRVVDWEGGTRIGASVEDLVRVWGPRGILRGAVVVICSDGLERGDPGQLATALARLRRHVHRIVWVNPLAGDDRYRPTQRGMVAALPSVDVLVPGDTLAGLEELVATLHAMR
jgi:uncharacterized protein